MANPEVNSEEAATGAEPADAVLLERFAAHREQEAFAALVQRHGPMVLGVCRRVLQHEQDAEDAFQAVFCVLARKASAIRRGTAVGAWLYAVACRTARKAKTLRVRRRMGESELPDVPARDRTPELEWRDLWPILDDEVNRLPERYRRPFVLCYLEGKTNHEAAAELRCPPGTVFSRLQRARERLRVRLSRRGMVLSAAALAGALGNQTSAATVQAGLTDAATQAALRYAVGQPVGVEVAGLADASLRAMARARWTAAVGLACAVVAIVAVVFLLGFRLGVVSPQAKAARSAQADQERLQGSWRVVLAEKGGRPPEVTDLVYIFPGDQVRLTLGGRPGPAFPDVLDVSQDPSAIDFTLPIGKVLQIYVPFVVWTEARNHFRDVSTSLRSGARCRLPF